MASIEGRRVPPLLMLWAAGVTMTFAFSGARIHYLVIDRLVDTLRLRFSADDHPRSLPPDGIIQQATTRPDTRPAEHEGRFINVEA